MFPIDFEDRLSLSKRETVLVILGKANVMKLR